MELNFTSVETIPNLNASAAFQVDSGKVFNAEVCYGSGLEYNTDECGPVD